MIDLTGGLRRLIYTSFAEPELSASALKRLIVAAEARNREVGLTGLLLYNGARFIQLIEGAEEKVAEAMERIARDRRHYQIDVQSDRAVGAPGFPDWPLKSARIAWGWREAEVDLRGVIPANLDTDIARPLEQAVRSASLAA